MRSPWSRTRSRWSSPSRAAGRGCARRCRDFYNQETFQNRVAFLTGPRDTYAQLIDTGKRLKAIQHILGELAADKMPDNDPQMIQAHDLEEKILLSFRSAVRETFTSLWYPTGRRAAECRFPDGVYRESLPRRGADRQVVGREDEVHARDRRRHFPQEV